MPKLTTRRAAIDYDILGAGPSLVFVHGSWMDRAQWSAVGTRLALRFTAVTYSRRGHGDSSGHGTLDDDVADLAAVIEELGLGPAHVVGNSMGATICLRLALERPDLTASVSVHEPPLFGLLAGDPGWQGALEEGNRRVGTVLQLIAAGQPAQAAERFVDDVAIGPGAWTALPPEQRELFIRHAPTFAEENTDPSIYGLDPVSLGALTSPVLLTGGATSPALFAPTLEELQRHLPRAQLYQFPTAGHLPHMTHPDEYAEVITAFVARLPARR